MLKTLHGRKEENRRRHVIAFTANCKLYIKQDTFYKTRSRKNVRVKYSGMIDSGGMGVGCRGKRKGIGS